MESDRCVSCGVIPQLPVYQCLNTHLTCAYCVCFRYARYLNCERCGIAYYLLQPPIVPPSPELRAPNAVEWAEIRALFPARLWPYIWPNGEGGFIYDPPVRQERLPLAVLYGPAPAG